MDAMLLLRASVLLALALIATRLLRRAPAALRHHLWTLGFVALLALPPLAIVVPPIGVPLPRFAAPAQVGPAAVAPTHAGRDTRPDEVAAGLSRTSAIDAASGAGWTPTTAQLLVAGWMTGTGLAVAMLLVSLVRAGRLARGAETLVDPGWRAATDALAARLGVRRPVRLLLIRGAGTPMAGGFRRPVIFLPDTARTWSAERRDIVLAHELAHLAGLDPLRHVVARLAVALYWFHPLSWLSARQATVAREQACDEQVIALGTRRSVYAGVLLDLAASTQAPVHAVGALPMVDRSLLEARLMAILNSPSTHTGLPARRGRLPLAAALVVTLLVAAARPSSIAVTAGVAAAPAPAPVAAPAAQPMAGREVACEADGFHVGTRGNHQSIQQVFDGLRLCVAADGLDDYRSSLPSDWPLHAGRLVLDARRDTLSLRAEMTRVGGQLRTSWQVGGRERALDAAARTWIERALAVLDTTWEISQLRGEVSSLRGEISSIRGEESSLRGEISSLHGHVSSLRGEISSLRGNESSLRGEISAINGHLSSLQGEISSERGAISAINGALRQLSGAERADIESQLTAHREAIRRLEQDIRAFNVDEKVAAVEREIASRDFNREAAALQEQIRSFDLNGKVAEIERRIAALDVNGKIADLERKIQELDAGGRIQQLEARRATELKQLTAAIAALK
jgi:beta-lactamase regulating signal transducer with metallopeptidase domain